MNRLTRKSRIVSLLVLVCIGAACSFSVRPAAAIDISKFTAKKLNFSVAVPFPSVPNQSGSYLTVNVPVSLSQIPLGWRSAKLLTKAVVVFCWEVKPGQEEMVGKGVSDIKETPLSNTVQFSKNIQLPITKLEEGSATNKNMALTFATLKRNDTCLFLGAGIADSGNVQTDLTLTGSIFEQMKGVQFDCSNGEYFPGF